MAKKVWKETTVDNLDQASSLVPDMSHKPDSSDPFDDIPEQWSTDKWETATALIWKPEKGDILMGFYDGAELFTEGNLEGDQGEVYKHFVIEWNSEIRYSMVGGQVFDKMMLDSKISAGDQVRIQYLGKKATGKQDRRVNLFDVKYLKS